MVKGGTTTGEGKMAASGVGQPKEVLEEWRELESDPGVFSLLVEDYGVRDIKVEEIYDVSNKIDTKVYGFVFLFRFVMQDRRSRKAARSLIPEESFVLQPEVVNEMFFAHQIINNSCATHALLSVLLNCKDVDLGPTLTKLKDFSKGLDPESKGLAITNMVELAHVHNKYAKPTHVVVPPPGGKRACVLSSAHALLPETYHFVSYVPINNRLFELDGLKEFPIDHGPWGEHEEWTDLFQRLISSRLAQSPDLLYNLLAIVQDPIPQISERLKVLHEEQNKLLEDVNQLASRVAEKEIESRPSKEEEGTKEAMKVSSPAEETSGDLSKVEEDLEKMEMDTKESDKKEKRDNLVILDEVARNLPTDGEELQQFIAASDASTAVADLDLQLHVAVAKVVTSNKELEVWRQKLKEELETRQRYRVEHSRRTHDYDPFISEFIKMLAQNGQLPARLLKKPSTSAGLGNYKRKNNKVEQQQNNRNKKQRTTLLVNGSKVN